jgi:hypothetical protein
VREAAARRDKGEMGKGAQGSDAAAAAAAAGAGEVNMAAWLVAKNTLKIMPFELPPLGTCLAAVLLPRCLLFALL